MGNFPRINDRSISLSDLEESDDLVDLGEDVISFPFSSEAPVERWWGTEVLSHDKGAIDLSRVEGMVFLWNHDDDRVLGAVQRVWLENQRAYCEIRWSKTDCVEEFRQNVADKILTNVSFRYSIDDIVATGDNSYTVTRWTPLEISLVSVPADPSVGIGRNIDLGGQITVITEDIKEQMRAEERTRIALIQALSEKHGFPDLARSLIEGGQSIEEARSKFLEQISSKSQQPVGVPINPLGKMGLSKQEEKQYSLLKVIRSFSPEFPEYKERLAGTNSFEREISDQIAKQLGRSSEGFFVPYSDFGNPRQQRNQNTGSGSTGGYLIDTQLSGDFITLLRNEAKVLSLGAQIISDLEGFIDFAKQNLAAIFGWVGENGELPDTEIAFDLISMAPKDFGGILTYTRRQLMQSSFSMETLIREEMAIGMALALDHALLWGTGTNNEPLGIFNRPVQSVSNGTDGAAVTYSKLVELKTKIKKANVQGRGLQWLTNASVEGKLQVTPKQGSGVEGNFILGENADRLMGMPFYTTEQIRSDLTKGNGTGLSGLVVGNFPDLLVGMWNSLEILPNTQGRTFKSGGIEVRVMQTMDTVVRHNESFGVMTDIVTTF